MSMIDDENIVEALKQINENIENSTDAFQKANSMRQLGFGLFQQALKEEDESALAFVVQEHFDRYLSHVSQNSCDSVNNYTKGVAQLLKNLNNPVELSNFKPVLKSSTTVNLLPCTGKFRECKSKEDYDIYSFEQASKLASPQESAVGYLKSEKNSGVPQEADLRLPLKRVHDTSPHGEFELLRNIPSTSSTNLLSLSKPCQENQLERISIAKPNEFNNHNKSSNPSDASESVKTRESEPFTGFRTAKEEFQIQNVKKYEKTNSGNQRQPLFDYGASKKSLGARRTPKNNFVPPIQPSETSENNLPKHEEPMDERLRNIDPQMVKLISNEIMHKFKPVNWSDIAGLDYAKSIIQEAVVWPLLRPDIFTGIRRPPRGILLFGPPGTGKTLIGKCIASQSKSTFFSISASSLTSKWIGEGEKMVRALFAVACVNQPAVIFIDEIDSLLCQRSESEHESSRRLKTEFLVQLDGAATSDEDRILIVGATNRPQELDEAARRRLVRRLYIPLPELEARAQILRNLLKSVKNEMSAQDICKVGELTEGYSGADMESVCREASMEPIRSIPAHDIPFFNEKEVRPINFQDFQYAVSRVKASNSQGDIKQYIDWNKTYGSGNV